MHLNALYRIAEAGKAALKACADALVQAGAWTGYAPRALAGKPLKYWYLRRARGHLATAQQHLAMLREGLSKRAMTATQRRAKIDSSGGFAVGEMMAGLLDGAATLHIAGDPQVALAAVHAVLGELGELMLRLRKSGAVS